MENSLNEWYERAEKGTSGDMVYDILSDWKAQVKQIQESLKKYNKHGGKMTNAKTEVVSFWADCPYCGESLVDCSSGSLLLRCEDFGEHTTTQLKCNVCGKVSKIPRKLLTN